MIRSIHQSSLGMFIRCAEQFRRRYLEGDKVPPGIAARIGTGLHKGAEVSNLAKVKGQREPRSVVVDAAVDGYKKACLNGVHFAPDELPGAKNELARGVDTTAALAGLYVDEVDPTVDPVAVEEKLTLDVGLDLPFVGTVDWRDRDPRKWDDIKTAARKWPEGKADSEIQATLYPRLVEAATGVLPTRLTYHVLTKTKEPAYQPVTTTRTEEDWQILIRQAEQMLKQIEAGLVPPADPGHWVCGPKYCGYFYTCPHIPARRKVLPKNTN